MIIIGKPINGISINGFEWLKKEDGKYMFFETIEEAKIFLIDNGCTEDSLDCFNFKNVQCKFCTKCGGIFFNDEIDIIYPDIEEINLNEGFYDEDLQCKCPLCGEYLYCSEIEDC